MLFRNPSKKIIPSKIFIILALVTLILHQSVQHSNTIPLTILAECDYRLDSQSRYSCYFNNLTTAFGDSLEIVGTHLQGRTDADVLAVYHINSRINRFNGEVLRQFSNLRFISLRLTNLQSISPTAFEVCANLEELNIEVGSVTSLAPLLFQNCVNFKNLRAFNNRIVNIPENLFGSTRSLEVFDLHRNFRLSSVPGNLFQNMTNLRMIDIGSNEMTQLDPRIFLNAVNFESFDISRNDFDDAQAVMNLLTGHLGMRRISIFSNRFPMFSFNFFTQFTRLEELEVGGLQNSTEIAWQALPGSLTTLRAFSIGEEIPENAFSHLGNLTTLDISGDGITVLQRGTFAALRNLEWLFVMYTKIKTIHPELFLSQGNLQILFLNWNEIEEIPAGALAPLVNLGYNTSEIGLHFFSNKLQRLSASSFGQHPHLDYIDFSFNEILKIDRGIFSRFSPTISYIGFRFNNCTHAAFVNATNLEEQEELQWCFNSFDGITTTTEPDSAEHNFRKIEIFVVIFLGFLNILRNFL